MGASARRRVLPQPDGFTRKRTEPCLDCMLREDLDMLGRPRVDRHSRIAECVGCGGTGTQPRATDADPYFTGRGV